MKNSTLIAVINALDKKERREFSKWLDSPFFNQRTDVAALFQYLVSGRHLEEDKFLEKERIFRKIFPKQAYDDAKFRQTTHFLLRQLELFLAHKEIESDPFAHNIALIQALHKRKLPDIFAKKFRSLQRQGLAEKQLDSTGLRHAFVLLNENTSLRVAVDRTKDVGLQDSINAFDAAFIAEKLKQACLTISHQRVFKSQYQTPFLDEVLATVTEDETWLTYPAIAIYYHGYQVLTNAENSDEHYYALKACLRQHSTVFSETEQRNIYLIPLNYCIGRMNRGGAEFVREAFDMYRETFTTKIVLENGVLSRNTYLNAILIALRLNEYKWVEDTIAHYTQYIDSNYRDSFRDFCLARMAFDRGHYSKAQELLIHFYSNDTLIHLYGKIMLLKIYYEEDEFDAMESLLESTKTYLKRKKVIGYHKDVFNNMVKYTRKLTRLNPYDKKKRDALRTEIENAQPLTDRPWLLEQLDKMER